jgi:MraZ protein
MKYPFLAGEFELTVDIKSRVMIPAEIRKLIVPEVHGEAFYLSLRGSVPCLYIEKYYEELINSRIRPEVRPSEELLAFAQLKFALVHKMECDVQGRVVLPERIIQRAELGKEVTMLGMRDHLQIWNRTLWTKRMDDLFSRSEELEQWAEKNLKPSPPPGNG